MRRARSETCEAAVLQLSRGQSSDDYDLYTLCLPKVFGHVILLKAGREPKTLNTRGHSCMKLIAAPGGPQ